jgi:hypothetical protein
MTVKAENESTVARAIIFFMCILLFLAFDRPPGGAGVSFVANSYVLRKSGIPGESQCLQRPAKLQER